MCVKEISAEVRNYVHFVIPEGNGSREVDVYPNKIYEITHFSEAYKSYITVNALVKVIGEDSLKYLYYVDPTEDCSAWAGRLCSQYKTLEMRAGEAFYTVISNIKEVTKEDNNCNCHKPPKFPKEVTKVAILGISAETIRSIIVRLRFYDDPGDCCDVVDAVPVDMKVGNKYNVSYLDHRDHTIYEVLGKLVSINIKQNFGDEPLQHGFIRPEVHECCHNAVEQIGLNNMTYCHNNDHFMSLPKDCPDDISFVFDTSSSGEATLDVVKLKDMRGCTLVEDEGDDFVIESGTDGNPGEIPRDPTCCGDHSSCCGSGSHGCGCQPPIPEEPPEVCPPHHWGHDHCSPPDHPHHRPRPLTSPYDLYLEECERGYCGSFKEWMGGGDLCDFMKPDKPTDKPSGDLSDVDLDLPNPGPKPSAPPSASIGGSGATTQKPTTSKPSKPEKPNKPGCGGCHNGPYHHHVPTPPPPPPPPPAHHHKPHGEPPRTIDTGKFTIKTDGRGNVTIIDNDNGEIVMQSSMTDAIYDLVCQLKDNL